MAACAEPSGSQREIETILDLEDEAPGTDPGSFELPSRIRTEFAYPTTVPGTVNWVDELRVLANRQCDHDGDRREGFGEQDNKV